MAVLAGSCKARHRIWRTPAESEEAAMVLEYKNIVLRTWKFPGVEGRKWGGERRISFAVLW